MARDEKNGQSKRRRGRGWRLVAWIGLILAGFLLVGYFVVTSNTFFKGFVLPRASERLNATVTVSEASISPFSQVILRDLKVQPVGQEPVLTARRVAVRYSLTSILRGRYVIEELALDAPTVRILRKPDGTSNLDPLLEGREGPAAGSEEPGERDAEPVQLDLTKLTIADGAFIYLESDLAGSRTLAELADLNVSVSNVRNGQTANVVVGTGVKFNRGYATNLSKLTATLNGEFTVGLNERLSPIQMQGVTELAVPRASGAFADAANIDARLRVDIGPEEIRRLTLRFARDSGTLGSVSVSGPFNLGEQEGEVTVEVAGIGPQVLSLVGGPYGIQFGETELAAKLQVAVRDHGATIDTSGSLTASRLSLTRNTLTNAPTPVIGLEVAVDASVDRAQRRATLRDLTLHATQAERLLLDAGLSEPMTLNWGEGAEAVPSSRFRLTVTNVNLADWRAFLGPDARTGALSGHLTAEVRRGGAWIGFNLSSLVAGLAAPFESNRVEQVDMDFSMRGALTNFAGLNLGDLRGRVRQHGRQILAVTGSGFYDLESHDADLKTGLTASLAPTTGLAGLRGVTISDGSARFTGRLTQTNRAAGATNRLRLDQAVSASLELDRVSGQWEGNAFEQLDAGLRLEAERVGDLLDLELLQLSLTPTARATNQARISGRVDWSLTNAVTGKLQLVAEALDLTRYYEAFGGRTGTGVGAEDAVGVGDPGSRPLSDPEPAPVDWPVRELAIEVEIGRMYIAEVAVSNLTATVQVDGGQVTMEPLVCVVNGGPVSGRAALDLGVLGYRYGMQLDAERVPLAPLVNTFQPDYRDKLGGTLHAAIELSGAGVTETNRLKNLNGQFDVGSTNLNLALGDVQVPIFREVIEAIRNLPVLVGKASTGLPAGVGRILDWAAAAAGQAAPSGWVEELSQSTVQVISGQGTIEKGLVNVQELLMQTPAFYAALQGSIALVESRVDLPVNIGLRRSLAAEIKYLPENVETNAAFVPLPAFMKIVGPLSKPSQEFIQAGLLQLGTQAAEGYLPEAAPMLDRLRNLLPGSRPATTNPPPVTPGPR